MAKKRIDPKSAVDLSINYYAILGIDPALLPTGNTVEDKQNLALILNTAYQDTILNENSPYRHSDMGGDDKMFMLLVRAHTILSDPYLKRYYDSGGDFDPRHVEDASEDYGLNWDQLGTWREGTTADTTGRGIFRTIYQRKNELGLVPAFYPTVVTDSYEWDFVIKNSPIEGAKLAISIVHDENEVLRLTSGKDLKDSLPFKIYICIPRAQLSYQRSKEETIQYEDGSVDEYKIRGSVTAATYSDYNLFETTKLEEVREYISSGGQFEKDIENFINGTLIKKQAEKDKTELEVIFVPKEQMNKKDAEVYRKLLWKLEFNNRRNEDAIKILENLPERVESTG